jgi:hypothetical protein
MSYVADAEPDQGAQTILDWIASQAAPLEPASVPSDPAPSQ